MSPLKRKREIDVLAGAREPIFTVRSVLALLLVVAGVAWIGYYYLVPRPERLHPHGPHFMMEWHHWNYLIGFALFFVGLFVAAHPSTPLGRGRGVVVGMLGCFLAGLAWICVFYVFSDDLSPIWVMNDLGQKNLIVGIAFMATGFAYATRWE
ncbi:MAG: cell division protein CrgA [Nocardioides sp.]|uniref:cell division protein CrgA n=1 Tax=Nocardioides sp. TaxID=35761 RepID=UPI0039E44116